MVVDSRVCVIGAGAAGLTTIKQLKESNGKIFLVHQLNSRTRHLFGARLYFEYSVEFQI